MFSINFCRTLISLSKRFNFRRREVLSEHNLPLKFFDYIFARNFLNFFLYQINYLVHVCLLFLVHLIFSSRFVWCFFLLLFKCTQLNVIKVSRFNTYQNFLIAKKNEIGDSSFAGVFLFFLFSSEQLFALISRDVWEFKLLIDSN